MENKSVISRMINYEAKEFYDVGSKLYKNCMNSEFKQEKFYILVVAMTNLSFSIELALKSFIPEKDRKKCGHDYVKMLKESDAWVRQSVIQSYCGYHGKTEEEFWDLLEINKDAFEDWRYYYERLDKSDLAFLYEVATILVTMVININSKINEIEGEVLE